MWWGAWAAGVGQENERIECFLDDLRAFGINADQWTTAAQEKGEWRKTAEQGAERFMVKWIAAEKTGAGLRRAVSCTNMAGRIKDTTAQSNRLQASSLAIVDYPQVVRTCILRAFGLRLSCCLSLVLRLFCFLFRFVFIFVLSLKPWSIVQLFFDMHAPRQPHPVT